MSCDEWQLRIAADAGGTEVEQHVAQCDACRQFAESLTAGLELLRAAHADPLPEAQYTALRARVMGSLQMRRRTWWVWAAAAGAVAVLWLLLPVSRPPVPRSLVARQPSTSIPSLASRDGRRAVIAPARRRRPRPVPRPVPQAPDQPLMVKMLTDDPNIVIYWIVDKKGDE